MKNSSRQPCIALQPPSWRGFKATFKPAPDPFATLTFELFAFSYFSPLHLMFRTFARTLHPSTHTECLLIHAKLKTSPSAELLWQRGRISAVALTRSDDPTLWERRALDLINGEFVVRGLSTSAIAHAFFELQTRAAPFLQRVSVIASPPAVQSMHIQIALTAARMTADDVPALLAAVHSLGRAALR